MRIIAGEYKGRRLAAPTDRKIRPTTDKVKEAVFSMLMPYLEDAIVVDLFSGTGNMGLEALSRGAVHCYFCDLSKESLSLVRQNVDICKAAAKSTLILGDYRHALKKIKGKVDLMILDPPYKGGLLSDCIDFIEKERAMDPGGIIVAEYGDDVDLPDRFGSFIRIKHKEYGTVRISIYELEEMDLSLMFADSLD